MTRSLSLRHAALVLSLLCGVACKKSAESAASCGAQGGEIASGGALASGGAAALGGAPAQGGSNDGTGAAAATSGAAGSGGSAGAPDSTTCSALALENCASNPMCQVLSGQRVAATGCVTASEPAACGTQLGCEVTPTRATDPTGKDWVFTTTCIPADWLNVSNTGTHFDPCPMSGTGAGGAGN